MRRRIGYRARSLDGHRVYHSGFERDVLEAARDHCPGWSPSIAPIRYVIQGQYTPDWILPNGIIIEVKGYFPASDRYKIQGVIQSNPDIDLRMVFSRPWDRVSGLSTPANWADQRGIQWADRHIPRDWFHRKKVS